MSKWGDRFIEHYSLLDKRIIEVPEIRDKDGNQLVISARPASGKAAEKILQAWSKSATRGYIEAMVLLSRDEDGEKVFDDGDRIKLLEASKDMLERVGGQIIRECSDIDLLAPFEDVVKNSEASPTAS